MNDDGNIRTSFRGLRQRSLSGEVRDEIERMILDGELSSGERLDEATLASRLGVSRGPVREAARSLGQEGLVNAVANKGVYVRELTPEEAFELYDLRALIAGYLCQRVAEAGDPAVVADLRERLGAMAEAAQAGDEAGYFELNLAFHTFIAEASGASRAANLYTSLGKEVRLMRCRVLSGPDALAISNAEHASIVEAIARGDADGARAAGARHHVNGKARLVNAL
jgi:DNA-binding GntR family transcriptional regulator